MEVNEEEFDQTNVEDEDEVDDNQDEDDNKDEDDDTTTDVRRSKRARTQPTNLSPT